MKTRSRLMVLLLGGALSVYGTGCQRDRDRKVEAAGEPTAADNNKVLSQSDTTFLMDADKSHVQEQALARLAKTKSQNNDVKDYADMLENDHTDALKDTAD